MLLERNQFLIGVVVSVLLAVGTLYAVGASGGMFRSGIPIRAEFTDSAGLESGNFVYVAGVRSGEVADVEITGDHVTATFYLEPEGIPNDSRVSVILQTTLGKRALKITPGSSDTPFQADDVIPLERTNTPVDFPELGDTTVELLEESDVDALNELTTVLADVTEGMREDVGQLLDGINRVTDVVADRRDDLATVIRRTEELADAAADKDRELVQIVDEFGSTLNRLAQRRGDISQLLTETAATTNTAADLAEERRASIDTIVNELTEDLAIVDRHQVDLAHLFAYAGVSVNGFASIGYQGGDAKADNPSWGNVFVDNLGQAGVEALLGCNGAVDELLTAIVGPDPNCGDGQQGPGTPAGDGNSNGAPAPTTAQATPYRPLSALFTPAPSEGSTDEEGAR